MIVCELSFDKPSPDRPMYSQHTIDYIDRFQSINKRVTLRKNLDTKLFEIYQYVPPLRLEQVIFQGSFEEALRIVGDEPCEHKEPNISIFCPKWPAVRVKR